MVRGSDRRAFSKCTLLYSRRVSTGLVGISMAELRPGMGRGPLEGAPAPAAALRLPAHSSSTNISRHASSCHDPGQHTQTLCWTPKCSRWSPARDGGEAAVGVAPGACGGAGPIGHGHRDRPGAGGGGARSRRPQHRGVLVLLVHLHQHTRASGSCCTSSVSNLPCSETSVAPVVHCMGSAARRHCEQQRSVAHP
jgi:hypothetical protein